MLTLHFRYLFRIISIPTLKRSGRFGRIPQIGFGLSNPLSWEKKGNVNFDIAMGAYDGAECCELVGLYLLNKITTKGTGVFSKAMVGLYRDDGLSIVHGGPGEVERVTKKLRKLFKTEGLNITCEAGKHGTDYLDLYFDLKFDKYRQ